MNEKLIREYDRFILRLPDGMRERMQRRAEANGRSMNAEAVAILGETLRDPVHATLDELRLERRQLHEVEDEIRHNISAYRKQLEAIKNRQRAIREAITSLRAEHGDLPINEDDLIAELEATRQSSYDTEQRVFESIKADEKRLKDDFGGMEPAR